MELAFAAGVSTRHANFLERDRANPSRATVRRLCAALEVDDATRDRMMLAAGFAPEHDGPPSTAARTADLRDSFTMALAIRQQSSVACVLRMASASLRELGLEDVFARDCTMSRGGPIAADVQSEEGAARELARRIICDSVTETLQRLAERG